MALYSEGPSAERPTAETYTGNHPELVVPDFFPQHEIITGSIEIKPQSEFTVGDLGDRLRVEKEKFFFHPDMQDHLPLGAFLLKSASFEEVSEWGEGRQASKSQVFFGNLHLATDGSEEFSTTFPIAVKPFHTWVRGAVHEYASYLHVNASGFIESYHPLGFWVDSMGKAFLLSHFEQDVETLDNVDWSKTTEDPLGDHLSIFEALRRSAYTLARWHGHGYAHGDAQAKNMAVDGEGCIRAVDLERLRLIHTPENPNISAMKEAMFRDARDFIQSIMSLGFLRNDSSERQDAVIRAAFLEPYRGALRHPAVMIAAKYGDGLTAAIEEVCQRLLLADSENMSE